jgi:hypothetical protein
MALADVPRTATAVQAGTPLRCRGGDVDGPLYDELITAGLLPPGAEGMVGVPLMTAGGPLGLMVRVRHAALRYSAEEIDAAHATWSVSAAGSLSPPTPRSSFTGSCRKRSTT